MCPRDRGVHLHLPLQLSCSMRLTLQSRKQPVPGAVLGPPVETPPNRLPGGEIRWQVTPRGTGPKPPTDRLDDGPVIAPPTTSPRPPVRKQPLDPSPHLISHHLCTAHDCHPDGRSRSNPSDTP